VLRARAAFLALTIFFALSFATAKLDSSAKRAVACDALHASSSRGHAAITAAREDDDARETGRRSIFASQSDPAASRFDAFRCPRDVQPPTPAEAMEAAVENVPSALPRRAVRASGAPQGVPELTGDVYTPLSYTCDIQHELSLANVERESFGSSTS